MNEGAEAWLGEILRERRIALTGPIELVHSRPWSTVYRAPAGESALFLKICAATQVQEPRVIEFVARESPDLVPGFVARHPSEPWVIMRDGGTRLRQAVPGVAQLAVWRGLLPRYAELQRSLLGREAELLATGLMDRRLDRIPGLLERVLDDDRWTPRESRARVRALVPAVERLCAELAVVGIGPSLDHDDLHDHNVLIRDGRASIIDWGDASLTHPFLVLAVTERFAAVAAGVAPDAPEIRALREEYLEPWTGLAADRQLRRAAEIGAALGVVTGALTNHEIVTRLPGAHDERPGEMPAALDRIAEAIGGL